MEEELTLRSFCFQAGNIIDLMSRTTAAKLAIFVRPVILDLGHFARNGQFCKVTHCLVLKITRMYDFEQL
jgi:hypothetical protein